MTTPTRQDGPTDRRSNAPRRTRRRRLVAPAVVAVLGALALGACAGADTPDAAPATTAPAETTTTTEPPEPAASRSFTTTMESPTDLPGYHVYRPVDVEATGEPLPVIVWANGGCVRHDATWSTLLDRLAAAGFVVVAITAPPEGSTLSGATSAADQALAIDWAEQQNEQTGGPLAGQLDLERVVAAGNSCGGITSLALAGSDPRVAAVFVLSGSSVGPVATREAAAAVMDEVDVPVGFVVGGTEDIANAAATQDFELLAAGIPAFVASREAGDHRTVSTDTAILADVGEIGINWLDVALNGNEAARESLTTTPCRDCPPGRWTVKAKALDAAGS